MSDHGCQITDKKSTRKKRDKYFCVSLIRHLPSAIFLLFLISGCAVWKPLPYFSDQTLPGLPGEYRHRFDYPPGELKPAVIFERKEKKYIWKRVEMPLIIPEEIKSHDLDDLKKGMKDLESRDQKSAQDLKLLYTNRIDYYIPRHIKSGERRPVILISPILGGNMVVDCFAIYYAKRGFTAAIVHRKRLKWDPHQGVGQVENYIRLSIIRLREALDWIVEQPEVDSRKIGAIGISYGAIMHTILAAVEPRIQYHILAMPAGPIADIMMTCPEKQIVHVVKDIRHQFGWSKDELHGQFKKWIKSEPLMFAPYVPNGNVLVYVALFDRVVGTRRSLAVWKALGRPNLRIIPFGHYGGILVFPLLERQSYRAFKNHLE